MGVGLLFEVDVDRFSDSRDRINMGLIVNIIFKNYIE